MYNQKTPNRATQTVQVGFLLVGDDATPLDQEQVSCLSNLGDGVRLAHEIVDMPTNLMHIDAFLEVRHGLCVYMCVYVCCLCVVFNVACACACVVCVCGCVFKESGKYNSSPFFVLRFMFFLFYSSSANISVHNNICVLF